MRRWGLGADAPSRDLRVSRQHRVPVRPKTAHRMFGTNEVLVAAK
ncbi:Hint domain-containing protein [Paracoccus luteus]